MFFFVYLIYYMTTIFKRAQSLFPKKVKSWIKITRINPFQLLLNCFLGLLSSKFPYGCSNQIRQLITLKSLASFRQISWLDPSTSRRSYDLISWYRFNNCIHTVWLQIASLFRFFQLHTIDKRDTTSWEHRHQDKEELRCDHCLVWNN